MNEITSQSSQETLLSDKIFWHGYIPFYETFFAGRTFQHIAEFGVYKGRSIRWLLHPFMALTYYQYRQSGRSMRGFILRGWIRVLESKYISSLTNAALI